MGSDLEWSNRPETVGSDLLSSVGAASLGGGGDANEGGVSGEKMSGGTSGTKVVEVTVSHLSFSSMLEDLVGDGFLDFLTFHSVLGQDDGSLDLAQLDLGFLGGSRIGEDVGVQGLFFADTPDGAVHHDAEDSLLLLEGSGDLDEFFSVFDEFVAEVEKIVPFHGISEARLSLLEDPVLDRERSDESALLFVVLGHHFGDGFDLVTDDSGFLLRADEIAEGEFSVLG